MLWNQLISKILKKTDSKRLSQYLTKPRIQFHEAKELVKNEVGKHSLVSEWIAIPDTGHYNDIQVTFNRISNSTSILQPTYRETSNRFCNIILYLSLCLDYLVASDYLIGHDFL